MSLDAALSEAWSFYDNLQFAQAAHVSSLILHQDPSSLSALACQTMSGVWVDGETNRAIKIFKKLIKRAPTFALLQLNLGSLYAYRGELDKAQACFSEVLSFAPENIEAFYQLTSVKKFKSFDDDCQRMRDLFDGGDFSGTIAASLCAALAKVYDDLGEFEAAFDFCMKANVFRGHSYATLSDSHHLSALKKLSQSGEFDAVQSSGVESEAPLFIVGMPRSGTSLVEAILGRHPLVRPCGEMRNIGEIEMRLMGRSPALRSSLAPGVDLMDIARPDDLKQEAEALLALVDSKKGDRYKIFTDKMPSNGTRLGLIAKLFPKARIIYVRRHPLDCCISNLFARFSSGYAYSTRQNWLASYYRHFEQEVEIWSQINGLRTLEVSYEALVADPETHARRMISFTGLDWDDACLDHTRGGHEVRTESIWQARQPINRGSVERWRNYEPWIQPLIEAFGGYEALNERPGNFLESD